MKRSVASSIINSEELQNNQCNSKKRKINRLTDKCINSSNKCQSSSNQLNFPSQFQEAQATTSDNSNARLPLCSNGFPQTKSWNPQWGYQDSWGTPRNNLNYHSFETQNNSSAEGSSNRHSHPQNPLNFIPQRTGVNPISFFSLENKFVPKIPINDNCKGTNPKLEKISKEILAHFTNYKQSENIFHQKVELWNELDRVLKRRFRCATHVFGSTLNGFGSHESDMDLCMFNGQIKSKKGKDDVRLLAEVRRAIRRECGRFISGNIELVPAKIPILKFYDHHGKIEVDLSCNNQTSIRNTNLLFCYSQMDWRVRPLVLAVKDWAKAAGINEARFSTLSSYCLTLMVLHFLQAGVKEKVVPNLHDLHPNVFHSDSNIFDLPFNCDVETTFVSKNKSSLGELLFGFFEYYDNKFDFSNDVGSIRTGKTLDVEICHSYAKDHKASPGQWSAYILMEEPFDRSNAGRAVVRRDKFDVILKELNEAHKSLKRGVNWKYLIRSSKT